MSTTYETDVLIRFYDPSRKEAICAKLEELGFDYYDSNGKEMIVQGVVEWHFDREGFAQIMIYTIWVANGQYCEVDVDIVLPNQPWSAFPFETFTLTESDYSDFIVDWHG